MKRIPSVIIEGVATYLPQVHRTNDDFLGQYEPIWQENHEKEKLIQCWEDIGRKHHYICNNDKNVLSMSLDAASRLMRHLRLDSNTIHGLICVTATPEYNFPSQAVVLSHHLGLESSAIHFDMNANCSGMVLAMEQATYLLQNHDEYERILIVGCSQASSVMPIDNPFLYTTYSDGAAAVILTKAMEQNVGFLSFSHHSDVRTYDVLVYPEQGNAHYRLSNEVLPRMVSLSPPNEPLDTIPRIWNNMYLNMMRKANYPSHNIHFVCSQFDERKITIIQNLLKMESLEHESMNDTAINVHFCKNARLYGYTGPANLIFTYQDMINVAKSNDVIFFGGMGTGMTVSGALYHIPMNQKTG